MALRTKPVEVTLEGRDKGKIFVITEMPAAQAEKWAIRAFIALSKSGVEIPETITGMGFAGVAVLGLKAWALGGVEFKDAEPLLDEMFACIRYQPSAKNTEVVRNIVDGDIEDIQTRLFLRKEVIELHLGFSIAGGQ